MEDAGTWPCRCRKLEFEEPLRKGGYVCSTVSELEEDRDCAPEEAFCEDQDLEVDVDAPEFWDEMRGGSGGATAGFCAAQGHS